MAEQRLFLTFKVTREGEDGHPMDHVLLPVDLADDGGMTDASFARVTQRIQTELRRKATRADVTTEGYRIEACRSCNAPVIWAATNGGKTMPVDAEPVDDGNVELRPGRYGGGAVATVLSGPPLFAPSPLRKSHFATCPQADEWRSK